jgi:hypothetical protein
VTWTHKLRGWLYRYGPAEVVGTATALLGFLACRTVTTSQTASAYAATLGELLGFYGMIGARELGHELRLRGRDGRSLLSVVRHVAERVAFEFGPAELLDSTIGRPFAIGLTASYLGPVWGVPAGKLAADAVFYALAVGSYELRQHLARARVAARRPDTSVRTRP